MTVFGRDAYPSLEEKAGALLNFLARNLGLVDGKNKPLALAATIAFLGLNGYRLTLTNDEAYTPRHGGRSRRMAVMRESRAVR